MTALFTLLAAVIFAYQFSRGVSFTVYLRETDYGQDEGENVEVTVSLNQQIFTDVAIELLLLTVSELQAIGLEGMVPNYPPPHAAKRNDDFMAVSPPLVYVFSNKKSISQRQPFQILLKNDELNEFEESFYVYVNVTSADFQSYNLDGVKVATVVIRASEDKTQANLTFAGTVRGTPGNIPTVTVDESEGMMTFTLNITANLPENPIMLNVVIEPESEHPAMIGSDIYLNTTSLMLTGSQREYTIQCVIVNNDIPEEVEWAVLRVVAASDNELDYNLEPSGFIIDINDDDDTKFGFTKSTLNVREGESAVVTVGFLDHDIVDISVSLTLEFLMGSIETGNALISEVMKPQDSRLTLSPQMTEQSFTVHIKNNDNMQSDRFFTIKLSLDSNVQNNRLILAQSTIRVDIADNDTMIRYGIIKDAGSDSALRVMEGGEIVLTVGILEPTSFQPDEDFVILISAKIEYGDASASDFYSDSNLGAVSLSGSTPRQDISIKTKPNKDLQNNRQFTVTLQQISQNSPLVNLVSEKVTIIIVDDDIGAPHKPLINVTNSPQGVQVTWNITIEPKYPVAQYVITITGLKKNNTKGASTSQNIKDPNARSTIMPYKINGTEYSQYQVVVCATNDNGTTCSNLLPIQLGVGGTADEEGGISAGAIAAIVIILLLLFLLVLLVILVVWGKERWRTYLPRKTEDKYPELEAGRASDGVGGVATDV